MRLSEAIRLGATMRPQAFDQWRRDSSCALAADAEAAGIPYVMSYLYSEKGVLSIDYTALAERFPINLRFVPCPECAMSLADNTNRFAVVYHLNDTHHWTRERISDFVELHEPEAMLPDTFIDQYEELEPRSVPESTAGFLE